MDINTESKGTLTELSVYDALEKRKLYVKRLDAANASMKRGTMPYICGAHRKGTSNTPEADKTELENKLVSNFQSIMALYNNISVIDSAISDYNATHTIKVDGKEYSIAAAIAKQKRVEDEILFYEKGLLQIQAVEEEVGKKNKEALDPATLGKFIADSIKDGKKDPVEYVPILTQQYKDLNLYEMVDPNKIHETLTKKLEDAENFKNRFHMEIVHSNYSTKITVDLN